MTPARTLCFAAVALVAAACSTPRPVLYPNEYYELVGPEVAQADVDACIALAEEHGAKPLPSATEETADGAVEDAATGAATGAAAAAVWGANVGRAAGAGAAAYTARGLVRRLFRRGRAVDAGFQLFVDRCLRERGYEVVGWQPQSGDSVVTK